MKKRYLLGMAALTAVVANPDHILADTTLSEQEVSNQVVSQGQTLEDAKKALTESQDAIQSMRGDVFEANSEAGAASQAIVEHAAAVETATTETAEAQATLETVAEQIPAAEQDVTSTSEELTTVEEQNKEVAAQVAAQERVIQTTESEVTIAQHAADLAKTTLENVEGAASNTALVPAQNEKTTAETRVALADTALETATANMNTAKANLDAKSKELQANIDNLQKVADATENTVTEIKDVTEVRRQDGRYWSDKSAQMYTQNNSLEVTEFNDKRIEYIELTPEQKEQVKQYGVWSYTPNPDDVREYAIEYINELRRQYGLKELTPNNNAHAVAEARVNEMIAKNLTNHYTELNTNRVWEIVGEQSIKTPRLYNTTILSDKQLAYVLILSSFTEYTNTVPQSYGHRTGVLFGDGDFGFAIKEYTNKFGIKSIKEVLIGIKNDSVNATGLLPEYQFVTQTINEKGVLEYRYKGQPVKFLPGIDFVYTDTKVTKVTSTDKEQAIAKLNEAKAKVVSTLAPLQAALVTAQTKLTAAQAEKVAADEALTKATKKVNTLTAASEKTAKAIAEAKATLAAKTELLKQAQAKLSDEKAKLEELTKQSLPLATARKGAQDAADKLATLQARQKELQAIIDKHAETIATAETKAAELKDVEVKAIARLDEWKAKLAAAEKRLSDAQVAFEKAQAEHDRLQALELAARDNVLATLPDGTVIAVPKTAPKAEGLPAIDIETVKQALTKGQDVKVVDGKTVVVKDKVEVLKAPAASAPLARTATSEKVVPSPKATTNEKVSASPKSSTSTLPETGEEMSALGLIGYAALSTLGLAALKRRQEG